MYKRWKSSEDILILCDGSTAVAERSTCPVLIPDVLLAVEASAEALLVAGGGLHHAGAHLHLHLPV